MNRQIVIAVVLAAVGSLAVERMVSTVVSAYKVHNRFQTFERDMLYYKEASALNDYLYSFGTPVRAQIIKETLEAIDTFLPKYFPNGPFTRQDMIAIALLESNFKQYLVGTSGEKGIFQIMPDQFNARNIKLNHFDVRINTELSLQVLRDKFEKHKDYKKAIIAYNGVVRGANGKWSEKYWKAFTKRREAVSSLIETRP